MWPVEESLPAGLPHLFPNFAFGPSAREKSGRTGSKNDYGGGWRGRLEYRAGEIIASSHQRTNPVEWVAVRAGYVEYGMA